MEILLLITPTWYLKFSFSSRTIPKNFLFSVISMLSAPSWMLGNENSFLYENMMHLIFETLTLVFFAFSHLFIKINFLFKIFAMRSVGVFFNEQVKVLSSAKTVNLKKLELFGKSFIKIKTLKSLVSIPVGHHSRSIGAHEFWHWWKHTVVLWKNMTEINSKQYHKHHMKIIFEGGFYGLYNQML